MSIYQAIVLGIIQGVTEFLPVSSSAHLLLTRWFLGWPEVDISFDIALHVGTLISILWYFRVKICSLFKGFFDSIKERTVQGDPYRKLSWLFILSCIPPGIAGVFFEDIITDYLRCPLVSAFNLILIGALLFYVERRQAGNRKLEDSNIKDAFFIGIAETLALAPGVSRSGITITAGLFRRMSRECATEFSFLMAIPVIGGGAVFQFLHLLKNSNEFINLPFILGMIASIISGYIAIKYLLRYLQKGNFYPFVYYRWLLGTVIIIVYLLSL
ncbi:MAG: undecaprenyl-diphosphatase UppP [Candidatus Eremiobacterota bacterium]